MFQHYCNEIVPNRESCTIGLYFVLYTVFIFYLQIIDTCPKYVWSLKLSLPYCESHKEGKPHKILDDMWIYTETKRFIRIYLYIENQVLIVEFSCEFSVFAMFSLFNKPCSLSESLLQIHGEMTCCDKYMTMQWYVALS